MLINVLLFGIHRERLAKATHGRLAVNLSPDSNLADLLVALDIQGGVLISLNGRLERDLNHPLSEGDEVHLVPPVGGGSA
jgi:molybdopterin converting factor small subunit